MLGGKAMAVGIALAALLAAAPRADAQYGGDRQPQEGQPRSPRRDNCSPSRRGIVEQYAMIQVQYATVAAMRQQHEQMQQAAVNAAVERHRLRVQLAEQQQRAQVGAYPRQSRTNRQPAPVTSLRTYAPSVPVQQEEKEPAPRTTRERRSYSPGVQMSMPAREERQRVAQPPASR